RSVELLSPSGPRHLAGPGVHQLGHHPYPARAAGFVPAHGAGEEIVSAEVPGDGVGTPRGVTVLERAAAGDHLESADLGELGPDLVGHAVGEVGVGRVTEVVEGE